MPRTVSPDDRGGEIATAPFAGFPFAATFASCGVVPNACASRQCGHNAVIPRYLECLTMLTGIAVVLLVLWLLGLVSSYTIGGFIHLLLVVAIVLFLVGVIQGRRPVV